MSNTMSTTNSSTQTAKKTSGSDKQEGPARSDWQKGLEALEQARDEVALKLHLASMEARSEWDKLDASIRETNHFHSSPNRSDDEKHSVVTDLVDKVREFGKRLADATKS